MRRAGLAVVLALALAGCGGSGGPGGSADRLASDAQRAAQSASAVHVFGSIVERGRPLTLDLHLVRSVGAVGRMGLGGGTVRLVRLGPKVYMNGDGAFWSAYGGPAAGRVYANKWLQVPTSSGQIAPFVNLTDIDKLFGGAIGSHGKIEKGGTTTYRGRKVVALKESGTAGGTLYVAASGKPYPVAIVSPNGGREGSISFDEWNRPVAISVPPGATQLPSG